MAGFSGGTIQCPMSDSTLYHCVGMRSAFRSIRTSSITFTPEPIRYMLYAKRPRQVRHFTKSARAGQQQKTGNVPKVVEHYTMGSCTDVMPRLVPPHQSCLSRAIHFQTQMTRVSVSPYMTITCAPRRCLTPGGNATPELPMTYNAACHLRCSKGV